MSPKAYIMMTLGGLFLLMVIFGNNPMDDVRKKRAERQGKKLVDKIEEANKKKGGLSGMFGGGGSSVANTGRTPGTVDWAEEEKAKAGNPSIAAGNTTQIPRGTVYNSNPNPFMNANPYMRPVRKGDNAQEGQTPVAKPYGGGTRGGDGYYPPPPLNKGGSQFGPQSKLTPDEEGKAEAAAAFTRKKNSAYGHPNFTTDDGHSLAYYGTKVYTFGENGEPKPLPDGKYPMYNGRWTMVVRGGEQTIANGDSAFWRQ